MKLLFLGIWIFSTAAISAEDVKAPLNDSVTSEVQWKAMLGQVDASTSKAVAEALKNEEPSRPYYQSAVTFSSANTDIMTAAFIEAKVPDCLHSDGLKRQPTFLLTGYLALPVIAVAKVRGKCI
ncbi:hypothetical protein FHW83_001082 [Duganella sp. SG902]|uniref:hypothetical protein n=1 Tax=Duganella sp. SG902 TaxID=2587016 RepID=UPI00159E867A|nr:hypothetical protein [Duganella sp. SG902]NVM75302.1 hypothetical protein [Duganella sp. SG902]